MENNRSLICINCPMGCHLEVKKDDKGEWLIKGNQCKRGITYAINEMTAPARVLTSTVKISNGLHHRLPVRTSAAIPKEKLFEAMQIINQVAVQAPVTVGDVIIKDILGTGVDVLASRSLECDFHCISERHYIPNKKKTLQTA